MMVRSAKKRKVSPWIYIGVITIGILTVGAYYFATISMADNAPVPLTNNIPLEPTMKPSSVPAEEQKQIDAWIEIQNLNQFGDAKDTLYAGGTPLFNEATSQYLDKYEYIVHNHPDKPWNK